MAGPTFTDEDWTRIQSALSQRTASGKARQMTGNSLAGIGYCKCGYALAIHRRKSSSGKQHEYIRCGRPLTACRGAMRLDEVELTLEEEFLDAYGDREMTRLVFAPGEDRS